MELFPVFVLWAAAVSGQDDKITCSVPPVNPFQDTVLTCNFPEDPSVTKRDFTVNHYVLPGNPDSVVDCWWLNGNLDCYVQPGFEYNKTVNRQISVTIRGVKSSQLGTYACQLANCEPSFLETCEFAFRHGTKDICNITQKVSEVNPSLTCYFSEDISKSQKNFTVYKQSVRDNMILEATRVLECRWEEGRLGCQVEDGYLYNFEVSAYITVQIPDSTKVEPNVYTCSHAGSRPDQQEPCYLHFSDKGFAGELKASDAHIYLLLLMLLAVIPAIIIVVWIRRKIQQGRQGTASSEVEGHAMLKIITKDRELVTKEFQQYLQKNVSESFKDMHNTFYSVPPVYFNKTRYKTHSEAGQVVYVPDPTDLCDVKHDLAMQHVMHCLRHMAEGRQEPMFILAQFKYEDYLNNPGQDFTQHLLPMPAGLVDADKRIKCFDFLIVHRHRGVLVGVVKAVSDKEWEEHKDTQTIIAAVSEAINQLNKAAKMLEHLLSDQNVIPTIRQALVLPNISSSSLKNAIVNNNSLVMNLRECLGAYGIDDPTELCLCAESLTDPSRPWDISSEVVSKTNQWFERLMTRTLGDGGWSDELHVTMIARFFGPATVSTLEAEDGRDPVVLPKTLHDAVFLTGQLFERPVMYPEMLEVLESPRVYLFGPPNSCKTRMLTLVGRKWLSNGCDILIVNEVSSKGGSFLVKHFQELTASDAQSDEKSTYGRVYTELCDLDDKKKREEVMQRIEGKLREKTPCSVMVHAQLDRQRFNTMLEPLLKRFPDLHLWIASCRDLTCPEGLLDKFNTRCLNTPPAVLREVLSAEEGFLKPADFQNAVDYLPPTNGPPVKYIRHERSRKSWRRSSHECMECGQNVGDFLKKTLRIEQFKLETHTNKSASLNKPSVDQRSSLQFRDILIVFERDVTGDNPFLKDLRQSGVAVHSVKAEKDKDVTTDDSHSARAMHVRHVETYRKRKIVVYVEIDSHYKDVENKQRALTSCTSQLILVRHS